MNLDARGETCPIPVIKTRRALKELPAGESLYVTVDNEIATQNLAKMCAETGWQSAVEKVSDTHYIVTVSGADARDTVPQARDAAPQASAATVVKGELVLITSDVMGAGDDTLGAALMKSFIFALAEQDAPPETMVFYNGGARLTTEGSAALADLKRLEAAGTAVHTCGACLNFYGLTEKLAVGSVSNMYAIVGMLRSAARVIRP